MPRITKVYTRSGDEGQTGLGGGQRVAKDSLRIEAYGTVDELNCIVGMAVLDCGSSELKACLPKIQNELFHLGSDLCILEEDKKKWPVPQMKQEHVDSLESLMDKCQEELSPLEEFILPGGTRGAATLHLARTVCRRAERICVALSKVEEVGEFVVPYLNRLSDTFFVLARYENLKSGSKDVFWNKEA